MWERIKNFLSMPIVWLGAAGAAVGAVALGIYYSNDATPPPKRDPSKPVDFTVDLKKLDASKPVGVFMFNVHEDAGLPGFGQDIAVKTGMSAKWVHSARNNFIEEMRKHYGDNVVVVDHASVQDMQIFAQQFNTRFKDEKPVAHFVAYHHQGTYDDKMQLAPFLDSMEAKKKRAVIFACGPDSSAYALPNFDYVILPKADGQLLGPEMSLKITPAYRDAIGWMRECDTADQVRAKFADLSVLHEWRDRALTFQFDLLNGQKHPGSHKPVVVTPPPGLPAPPPKVIGK